MIYINYLTSASETLYPALIERVTLRAGEKFGSQGIKYLCQKWRFAQVMATQIMSILLQYRGMALQYKNLEHHRHLVALRYQKFAYR